MQFDRYLPAVLDLRLERRVPERGETWAETDFVASSPQFPGLQHTSPESQEAIADLLCDILNRQTLSPDVVAALKIAGYSDEVVEAWRGIAQSRSNRHLRYDGDAATAVLKEYTDGGVPALIACAYLELGIIEPSLAIEAHAGGGTPEDAQSYIDHSETHKWWRWDYDIDPWIRSAFPFQRGQWYAMTCSVEAAQEWESVVAQHGIADEHIETVLRAGLTPGKALAHLRVHGQDVDSLVAEARRVVAAAECA